MPTSYCHQKLFIPANFDKGLPFGICTLVRQRIDHLCEPRERYKKGLYFFFVEFLALLLCQAEFHLIYPGVQASCEDLVAGISKTGYDKDGPVS